MEINYNFVPQYQSQADKEKSDIISYGGKLLEILDARTAVVFLDNDDRPVVLSSDGRLTDALDFELNTY